MPHSRLVMQQFDMQQHLSENKMFVRVKKLLLEVIRVPGTLKQKSIWQAQTSRFLAWGVKGSRFKPRLQTNGWTVCWHQERCQHTFRALLRSPWAWCQTPKCSDRALQLLLQEYTLPHLNAAGIGSSTLPTTPAREKQLEDGWITQGYVTE